MMAKYGAMNGSTMFSRPSNAEEKGRVGIRNIRCQPSNAIDACTCPTPLAWHQLRKYDRGYLMVGSVGLHVLRQPVVSEGYLSAVYLATADWRGLKQQPLTLFGSLCRS